MKTQQSVDVFNTRKKEYNKQKKRHPQAFMIAEVLWPDVFRDINWGVPSFGLTYKLQTVTRLLQHFDIKPKSLAAAELSEQVVDKVQGRPGGQHKHPGFSRYALTMPQAWAIRKGDNFYLEFFSQISGEEAAYVVKLLNNHFKPDDIK